MSDKIKVLIVDDNPETRDGTARLLEYEDGIEVIDYAENGLEAIEKVKERSPDVVLMDINMPQMDGLTATQHLRTEAPYTKVVIVSVQDDPDYMRRAMRSGASDFVAKPVTPDELAQAIRRAYEQIPVAPPPSPGGYQAAPGAVPDAMFGGRQTAMPTRQGKVIVVFGPKGGVGTTTIATNLAIGMVHRDADAKVVVVDASPFFGDVSVFLNARGAHNIVDLAEIATDDQLLPEDVERILVAHESGVRVLMAPTSPGDSGTIMGEGLANVLAVLKQYYDYVIVDTASSVDAILSEAITAADRMIVLATPDMPSLKNTKIFMGELGAIDYPMDHLILVLNRVDRRGRITVEQINNFLQHEVAVQIPSDPNAVEAVNRAVPLITMDAKRVPCVSSLWSMVQLVMDDIVREGVPEEDSPYQDERRGGLLGGLLGG